MAKLSIKSVSRGTGEVLDATVKGTVHGVGAVSGILESLENLSKVAVAESASYAEVSKIKADSRRDMAIIKAKLKAAKKAKKIQELQAQLEAETK